MSPKLSENLIYWIKSKQSPNKIPPKKSFRNDVISFEIDKGTSNLMNSFFAAYNGSLISSLTLPTLASPLEKFRDILDKAAKDDIAIMTQK